MNTHITGASSKSLPRHHTAHDAVHPSWRLGRQSAIFVNNRPCAPNLAPIANEMCNWLQQKGRISIVTEAQLNKPFSFTNPYAHSATSLAAQLASVINQTADFAASTSRIDCIEAEMQRIRLESELILLFARFCEAAMKQMLYCTSLHKRNYECATLGKLLSFDCMQCRKEGSPHHISLLGALAHHYFECHVLESCLLDHLAFLGTRRNKQSAHSESEVPRVASIEESRSAAKQCLYEVGQELGHMCQHIGEIEEKMVAEINLWINHFPNTPSSDELMRIPVRFDHVSDPPTKAEA